MIAHSKLNSFELLPTELLDTIFDYPRQDITSLKACSLVCHTLRSACQAHIFHTASLEFFVFNTGTGPVSSHRQFLDVVSASPYLASLVRELRFTRPRNAGPVLLRTSEEERAVHQGVVAQILAALPQLRALVIRTPSGSLMWRRLSVVLTTALSEVVQLPTLRRLDLGITWEAPSSFFKSLTNLQVLRFAELNIPLGPKMEILTTAGPIDRPSHTHVEHGYLQSLSILSDMTFPCIDALFLCPSHPLDITHLRSLTLAFITDEFIVRRLLEACGKSLFTFRIHVQQRGDSPSHEEDIGLQYLQNVTSLTLSSSMAFTRSCESFAIRWLTAAMNTLPSLGHLEKLTIIFEISYIQDILIWEEATWSTLDSLLVHVSDLRSVHLLFHLRSSIDLTAESERLSMLVRERAVQLADSGLLKIRTISKLPSYFL
ncbi:hypothetical protein BDZ94DRAFT_1314758 [Collybia nuda]|uniref:F-box domain-containing protein n=1 Tax=Collybia nuda TaxID=64659 RepID=A0A9P6C978_9AGAR|nr:hypothetical protein BDZ94DRAFT_1314758 [Collybia nuda]